MKGWRAGVAASALSAPVSFLLVAVVAGGPAGLARSQIGLAVIAVSIVVAGISASWIDAGRRSREHRSPAFAVVVGLLIGILSLAVMGIIVLVAALIYFKNSHFTW
jgi:hypothetical protein